ncbi:MAG: hypothetical protein SWK76_14885 [Actinomycetota bacterium]|nr:hypothetical protein [Actinomycetota bacterium]
MPDIDKCPECRVPRQITSEHIWRNNGVIISKRDSTHRMVFFESDNLDHLYHGIAELIGMPIEHLVIDASRRSTQAYIDRLVPDDIKELMRQRDMEISLVIEAMFTTSRLMGYGRLSLVDVRYEGDKKDFVTVRLEKPYSLPLCYGNFSGTVEALIGGEPGIEYGEVSPGVYEAMVFSSEIPSELKKRLHWRGYLQKYKEGHIELERCGTCGGPRALSSFHWDLDMGVIRSTTTGKRMVITGPSMIDPVFEDLEQELGDSIPRVVVEAQKRFVKTGFFSVGEVDDEASLRSRLALRGLGNMVEVRMGRKGVRLVLENAALHLLGVGMAQGLYELAFNVESEVDWELSEDGVLHIEVNPKGHSLNL